jgi:hypothetical protein
MIQIPEVTVYQLVGVAAVYHASAICRSVAGSRL